MEWNIFDENFEFLFVFYFEKKTWVNFGSETGTLALRRKVAQWSKMTKRVKEFLKSVFEFESEAAMP